MSRATVSPSELRPDVTVSVVDHRSTAIGECLRSLARSTSLRLEVYVIENLPAAGPPWSDADFARVTVLRNTVPAGFSENHNKAISLGSAAYHLVLNDDTIIPSGALDALVAFADAHPRAGVVSPRLVDAAGQEREQPTRFPTIWTELWRSVPWAWVPGAFRGLYPLSRLGQSFQPDRVTGAFVLLRRAALERTGAFDPAFVMYYEEPDLCRRIR